VEQPTGLFQSLRSLRASPSADPRPPARALLTFQT
jgi:hypothetical protein